MELLIGTGMRQSEHHDYAKPEGRPRAAGHDLVLSDSQLHDGDVMVTTDLYPVHDGANVTATVTHLGRLLVAGEAQPVEVNDLQLSGRQMA
jgi:hypothetical protein